MKKISKYMKPLIAILVVAVFCMVSVIPSAEAARGAGGYGFGSQSQNQNQNQWRYTYQYQNLSMQDLQTMLQLLIQLRERLQAMIRLQDRDYSSSDIQIVTRSATDIEIDEALLRGRIASFSNSDYVDVWFEYDTSRNNLDEETNSVRIDEDEDEYFEERVTNLDEDTVYYFRAVGEDDEGDRDYGSIASFRTDEDDSSTSDTPYLSTYSATDIQDDSAVLRGLVDMNDFSNGEVFFVYGEDEIQVEDVQYDFDSYADVDEDDEDLQKVLVDSDLDAEDAYEEEVENLDANTEHYFSICVGYEDDGDDMLKCGTVRTFTTD